MTSFKRVKQRRKQAVVLSSSSRTSEEVHYHYVRFGGEDASTLDKVRSSSFGPLCFYWSFSSDDANEIYCVP